MSASTTKLLPALFKLIDALFGAITICKQDDNGSAMKIVDDNKRKEESTKKQTSTATHDKSIQTCIRNNNNNSNMSMQTLANIKRIYAKWW